MDHSRRLEAPFAVGAVSRLTGLSPHVLRSWERRYGAVQPLRTPGGTRRYTEADVSRLRLLSAGVGNGHPISALAPLSDAAIAALLDTHGSNAALPFEEPLAAIASLDTREVERLLSFQLLARGPRGFARDFALPLFAEIGERWESGRLSIAAEHLATFVAGNLLAGALRTLPPPRSALPLLFGTPAGERHEFGALVAALVSAAAGADAIYLGPDLPADEFARAAALRDARAVALGVVALDPAEAARYLRALRDHLDPSTALWIGGAAASRIARLPDGVSIAASLDDLEARVRELRARGASDLPMAG